MSKIGRPCGIGSLLAYPIGKLFECFHHIGSHIALLADILLAPSHILRKRHSAGKCNSFENGICRRNTLQQDFRACCQPRTTLRSAHQRDKHSRITLTGFLEKHKRRLRFCNIHIQATGKNNLAECTFLKLRIEIAKIKMIAHLMMTR